MRPASFRPTASSPARGPTTTSTAARGTPNPVTIDARTLTTTYNVLDNHSGANELWLRSGFQWDITSNVQLKSQVYAYDAQRHWFNNEINSFNDNPASANFGQVYRERLSVDHDQKLYGNVTDLTINSNIAGMDNRFVTTLAASSLQFNVVQDDFFNNDIVNLVNPDRGLYGTQQTKTFLHPRRQCLAVVRRPAEADVEFRADRRHPRRGNQAGAHRVRRRRQSSKR